MYEPGFAYLLQAEHQKVIYGVLKRLNVRRQAPDYEDLVVEGQIAFAKAYCGYCATHRALKESEVMPYIYQQVKWRLLDILRKQAKQKQRECGLPESAAELWATKGTQFEDVLTADLVRKLWDECIPKEQQILALSSDYSVSEIAKILAVSRKTVYKYKRSIFNKLRLLSQKNS